MKKFFTTAFTKYFWVVISISLILFSTLWYYLISSNDKIDLTNKIVDSLLKSLAILVALLWFLNRFFSERKDLPKFEIKLDVNAINTPNSHRLIIFRLDTYNTSNVLFSDYESLLIISGIVVDNSKISRIILLKLPESGHGPGLSIEPDSWAAINHEILIASNILALRFFYEIKKDGKVLFNWHKTVKI